MTLLGSVTLTPKHGNCSSGEVAEEIESVSRWDNAGRVCSLRLQSSTRRDKQGPDRTTSDMQLTLNPETTLMHQQNNYTS
ncbi:hypothetical protein CHS0354_032773 [Potamilus streckersoni]|uniref:Uncharacterized protein n=1 Tax=Potamilus streckersoni TaxID=2493646 RepID=A0AAE0W403_9BIVA|nr:hypothetical protein CHS0354_032773 [Potamilus streckersoni]